MVEIQQTKKHLQKSNKSALEAINTANSPFLELYHLAQEIKCMSIK